MRIVFINTFVLLTTTVSAARRGAGEWCDSPGSTTECKDGMTCVDYKCNWTHDACPNVYNVCQDDNYYCWSKVGLFNRCVPRQTMAGAPCEHATGCKGSHLHHCVQGRCSECGTEHAPCGNTGEVCKWADNTDWPASLTCVAPGKSGSQRACSSDSDCPNQREVCSNGRCCDSCAQQGYFGSTCQRSAYCKHDQFCVDGYCSFCEQENGPCPGRDDMHCIKLSGVNGLKCADRKGWGESCKTNDWCNNGLACSPDKKTCGYCGEKNALCGTTHYCTYLNDRIGLSCEPRKSIGSTCSHNHQCESNACGTDGHCGFCLEEDRACNDESYCGKGNNHLGCIPRKDWGQSCKTNDWCKPGLACSPDKKTCGYCGELNGLCNSNSYCTYLNNRIGLSCEPRKPLDSACTHINQCASLLFCRYGRCSSNTASEPLTMGKKYRFKPLGDSSKVIRHSGYMLSTTNFNANDGQQVQDSSFIVKQCKSGQDECFKHQEQCVTLESANYANHYIVHQGGKMKIFNGSGTSEALFHADASWCVGYHHSPSGKTAVYLRSTNYPADLATVNQGSLEKSSATFYDARTGFLHEVVA